MFIEKKVKAEMAKHYDDMPTHHIELSYEARAVCKVVDEELARISRQFHSIKTRGDTK